MKKSMSLFLSFALIFTTVIPVFAVDTKKAKVELKQAIEIAKEKLNINTEGYNFNSSYSEDQEGRKNWYLNWEAKKGKIGSINASVNADTGDITNFNTYVPSESYSKIPKYSREQALKVANEFAIKLQPEKIKETKILEQDESMSKRFPYYSDTYMFTYTRIVNGIPYIDNKINVNVDKNSLKVRDYFLSWDDKELPDVKKAISTEEAKKLFKEKLGVEASYNLVYTNYNEAPKVILAYTFINGNKPIDAITGQVVNYSNYYPEYGMGGGGMLSSKAQDEALTPEEDKNVEDTSKLISKEKAMEVVNQYMKIESKDSITSSNLNPGYPKGSNSVWYFGWEFRSEDGAEYSYKGAMVDAVTGELKGFNQNGSKTDFNNNEKPKYSKEQTKDIAENFLKKIQPEKFAMTISRDMENMYEQEMIKVPNYGFNYIKKVDDIAYLFDRFNVNVSSYTGEITSYNMDWYEPALPKAEEVISLEEAYNNFFEKQNFSLKYVKHIDYKKEAQDKSEIKLVFVMDNISNMQDAKTGEMLDYSGKPINLNKKTTFTDVKGHWTENEIYKLADMGIIAQTSEKYLPGESIKQKDFIKMLMRAIQPEYSTLNEENEYDSYYLQAVNSKIIFAKERVDDKSINRADTAKFLVRAMNLGYIANLKGAYIEKFKDVKDEKKLGYVTLVTGLGIMSADKGFFLPNKAVTRGESAVMIVRYLKLDAGNKE